LINGASASFNTLKELETELLSNETATTNIINSLSSKADQSNLMMLSDLLETIQTDLTNGVYSGSNVDLSSYALSSSVTSKSYIDSQDAFLQTQLDTLTTNKASYNYVDTQISGLVGSSPAALNTIYELASALGGDSNFSTTVINSISTKANDSDVVHKSGSELIYGVKTFSDNIIVPSINGISNTSLSYLDATSSIQTQLNSKANTNSVVDLSTTQTIGGIKTFSNNITISSINNITNTTLGYLDATSSIQTQINSKVGSSTSNTFTNTNVFQQVGESINTYGSIVSNTITINFNNGLIYIATPANTTNNSLVISNVPSGTNKSYTFTLIFDVSINKAFINQVNVNSNGLVTPKFIGGSTTINVSSSFMIQSITILFNSGSSTIPYTILSSVSSFF
jgi:hypothetical protein